VAHRIRIKPPFLVTMREGDQLEVCHVSNARPTPVLAEQVREIIHRLVEEGVVDVHGLGRFHAIQRPAHGTAPDRKLVVMHPSASLWNVFNPKWVKAVPQPSDDALDAPDILGAVLAELSEQSTVDIAGLGGFSVSDCDGLLLPTFHMSDTLFGTVNPGLGIEDQLR
jgi:hypothetical protein